ncbi:hypothetical protein O181_006536 [Austropuccinia psidii MF-1]|uniref:Uncharacterized protein n=1 Tax=Austropuccinia psidii MF-1 TaxID=1389203 RepID=A0A9Q3BL30_9BASI|nr:hypothetical protein [Austropuccinia psidii MF-1]
MNNPSRSSSYISPLSYPDLGILNRSDDSILKVYSSSFLPQYQNEIEQTSNVNASHQEKHKDIVQSPTPDQAKRNKHARRTKAQLSEDQKIQKEETMRPENPAFSKADSKQLCSYIQEPENYEGEEFQAK